MRKYSIEELSTWPRRQKASFLNCISGQKSAYLIGTTDETGVHNAAIFNSVIHLGANPALVGILSRPLTVERHTYQNIKARLYYTINLVSENLYKTAHQTSASYVGSEFEALAITPEINQYKVPYVAESPLRFTLKYKNEYPIEENGTILIVGELVEVFVPENAITEDREIEFEELNGVVSLGLNNYYKTQHLKRIPYAEV